MALRRGLKSQKPLQTRCRRLSVNVAAVISWLVLWRINSTKISRSLIASQLKRILFVRCLDSEYLVTGDFKQIYFSPETKHYSPFWQFRPWPWNKSRFVNGWQQHFQNVAGAERENVPKCIINSYNQRDTGQTKFVVSAVTALSHCLHVITK